MPDQERILAISPHPDDESIGCGGTLHQRAAGGDVVEVVFLTSGEQGGHDLPPHLAGPQREQEARDAAALLGVSGVEFWREPDGSLEVTTPLVERLKRKIVEFRPGLILVPHEREDHADHQAAAQLVFEAVEAAADELPPDALPSVWMYEVWTPIQCIDHIVDITAALDAKLAAVRAHKSQCDVMRFDDACQGLARYRGEMHCWPEGEYAEAFAEWRRAPRPVAGASACRGEVS